MFISGFWVVRVVTYISNTRVSYKKQELFILQELLCSSRFLVGFVLLHI